MSRVYDNWEKLVEAVLDREKLRRLALSESLSSSVTADFSSRFSFDSSIEDLHASSSSSNFSHRDVKSIELREIIKATKNFQSAKFIGLGAFYRVYKGWIDMHTLTASKRGSGKAVAAKKWYPRERHQDWVKEIHHLIELRHPNLVELVGYCSEGDGMILVYEFMPNKSLDNHLFSRKRRSLPWATRIKVAINAARGLSYLHDRETPVIHRDFKTANILLDEEFNAKLSNYCFGRDDPTGEMTHVSTDHVIVTYGYIAPEYEMTGQLTTKSNVYTFGVVLLELLTAIPAFDINRPTEQSLAEWAKPYLGDGIKLLRIIDTGLEDRYSHNAACKIAELASQCLSLDPGLRPSMAEVVAALEQL